MAAKTARRRKAPPRIDTPPPPERVALTVAEAAAVLGLAESTVWGLLRAGKLPRVRIGRNTRINRAVVEAYAATGDGGPPRRRRAG